MTVSLKTNDQKPIFRMILLSSAYFPPIQYFTKLLTNNPVYIEQYEHFIKQTYRNRTVIMAANGVVSLIIPVVKGRGSRIKMKDLRISYDEDWQRNHWRTIFSAYNSSPYFEYYQDDIAPYFEKKYKYLQDLNIDILETCNELLEIAPEIILTNDFEETPDSCINFREKIHPQKKKSFDDLNFKAAEYTQVFAEKFPFAKNLSILDLLFNKGPEAYTILENSIQ